MLRMEALLRHLAARKESAAPRLEAPDILLLILYRGCSGRRSSAPAKFSRKEHYGVAYCTILYGPLRFLRYVPPYRLRRTPILSHPFAT
jgi:hypothetical protein